MFDLFFGICGVDDAIAVQAGVGVAGALLFFGICGVDDAIAVLGLAATAASAGVGVAGAQQAKRSANKATQAELSRQADYQKKASSVFQQSLAGSTPQQADTTIDTGTAARQADYAKAQSVPLTQPGESPIGGQSSHLVTTASTGGQDRLANASRARLAGYNEWDLSQAIKDLQMEQQLGLINNFSGRSASLLPGELNRAAHSGDSLQGIGQLLGLGGSLAGAYSNLGPRPSIPSAGGLAMANPGVSPSALMPRSAPLDPWQWAASQVGTAPTFSWQGGHP